jgi:predicted polyphosphate/ATP-dependent NAD kinase
MKRLGLIINPVAGIGGAVGLKGSDGEEIQALAWERGAEKKAGKRMQLALEALLPLRDELIIITAAGAMGEDVAKALGFEVEVVRDFGESTTSADTEELAQALVAIPVDLLLFAGGDGTARNVYAETGDSFPVIGIPAGVKIHSAVYAMTPARGGETARAFLDGLDGGSLHTNCSDTGAGRAVVNSAEHSACVARLQKVEVMDIDEDAYRAGKLYTRLYGYMSVPSAPRAMQKPKAASHNSEEDVSGICFEIAERIAMSKVSSGDARCDSSDELEGADGVYYVFGAGSTVYAIMNCLGYVGTLIGVDVVHDGKVVREDATEAQLLKLLCGKNVRLIITAIGGQGHIFGRGNQQLSPEVIRTIGKENIWVVATTAKIFSLDDRCLYVDTGDDALDAELRGYHRVITGYSDEIVCRVL